jgi:hypothetical protein
MLQCLGKDEQYLLELAADLLARMTELEQLRVAVGLAEAAKALRSAERPRRQLHSKVADLCAGPQLRV